MGIPASLLIYNLGNPDTLNIKYWPTNKPNLQKKITSVFSKKQVLALAKTSKGLNNWFLKSGNEPVISDSLKIEKSVNSLKGYYFNKGFFNVEANHREQKSNKKKHIKVTYNVETGKPYFIDSIRKNIASPILDSLYTKNLKNTFIKSGKQYDAEDFQKEENRIVELFRNSGVYHFGQSNMKFFVDTINTKPYGANIKLDIPNRIIEENDSIYRKPYKVYTVKRVNVFTDYSFENRNKTVQDSAVYNGIHFYSFGKLKYKPKHLSRSIIITPGGVYKDSERDLTRKSLRELQNFSPSIDLKYQENEDETLTTNIYVSPLKKYSLGWDADFTTSNIKPFGILGKVSFLSRNLFKGADVIELSFQGSFLNSALQGNLNNDRFFNAYEIGSSITVRVPRIVFPLNTDKIIPKRMAPKTNISLSIGLQDNIGLDRQNISASIDYEWQSSKKSKHQLGIFNLQYINNRQINNYFNIYQSELQKLKNVAYSSQYNNIQPTSDTYAKDENNQPILDSNGNPVLLPEEYIDYVTNNRSPFFRLTNPTEYKIVNNVSQQRRILIEDVLIPVMSYTYNYSNQESFNDRSFTALTARFISAGNVTTSFLKEPANNVKKQLFGLQVAQYMKFENEYIKHWVIDEKSEIAFRNFLGIAFPYGNSEEIPFSRSYRAGGSNDIRAWRTFDLGRGSELSSLEFNVGNLKLTTNLEYRFNLLNSLNGALFVDAGNIWDISNSPLASQEAKFNSISALKDIAVGSGFGLRYDFSFLVFRLDTAFKTYEPYLNNKKWFVNYNLKNAVYNIGINYPF